MPPSPRLALAALAWLAVQGSGPAAASPVEIPLQAPVSAAAFSQDGALLALAGQDQTLVIFDVQAADYERAIRIPGTARCLAFSPDRRELAAGLDNKDVIVLSLATGRRTQDASGQWVTPPQRFAVLAGHAKPPERLEYPSARTLKSSDAAETFEWDPSSGKLLRRARAGGLHKTPGPCVQGFALGPSGACRLLSSDGRWSAVAGDEGVTVESAADAAGREAPPLQAEVPIEPPPGPPAVQPPGAALEKAEDGGQREAPPGQGQPVRFLAAKAADRARDPGFLELLDSAEAGLWVAAAAFLALIPLYFGGRFLVREVWLLRRAALPARIRSRLAAGPGSGPPGPGSGPPGEACAWFERYLELGGDPATFSPEEVAALYVAGGRDKGLLGRTRILNEAQLLGVGLRLADEGRANDAVRLLVCDGWLFAAVPSAASLDALIRIYGRAGRLDDLLKEASESPAREFALSLAGALVLAGKHEACVSLLRMKREKFPGECRLLASTLRKLERDSEALDALSAMGMAEWTEEEYLDSFCLCLRIGRLDLAGRLYERVARLKPLAVAPELHYAFARRLEDAGRRDRARDIYRRFISADTAYKDVVERFGALAEPMSVPPTRPSGAAAAPAPVALPDGKGLLAGKYELRFQIGQGGMGMVYEGHDRVLGRRVAIKKLRPELKLDPKLKENFLQEARIVSHLSHPGIVGIHDIVEQDGDLYLVFQFVEGRPLSRILDSRRLTLDECRKLFDGVCQAVAYAHGQRVLHRDLKPANIMVDAGGRVLVMDFGIAREAKESLTSVTGMDAAGTPAYMAPEQHMGKAGKASDVYCIGVCLYEALTGELPFKGPDFLSQKERRSYAPPQFIAPGLPRGIELLMNQVLDPDPRRRLADAAELAGLLKAV